MPAGKADDYLTPEPEDGFEAVVGAAPRWKGLLRSGTNARREDRPNMFYPVLLDVKKGEIVGAGKPLLDGDPDLDEKVNGYTAAWPIRTNGQLGNWGVGHVSNHCRFFLGVWHDVPRNLLDELAGRGCAEVNFC